MVAAGLVDEAGPLPPIRDGVTWAPCAIGYKEIVEALDGNITPEEAVQAIKTATRLVTASANVRGSVAIGASAG